ncbi:putative signal transducing protein [Alienimonas sp. DA493]|uniref:putative signal transducing protein n=1 Tax=Alienimonas sp. DA493 TaxID=3373605 RepID=UPI0037541E3E
MNTPNSPAPAWNPSDDEDVVEVASCANDAEAAGLAATLNEAGIPCKVVQEGSGVGGGGIPLGSRTEPKLWVREHDAEAASRLIREMRDEIEAEHRRHPHREEE